MTTGYSLVTYLVYLLCFHLSRDLSDAEVAQLNAISANWDFDGGFETDDSLWINAPMDAALVERFAICLDAMPA